MMFRQFTHDDLGCASYLLGDEDAGIAAVVDPKFEIDEYLEFARYTGVSIEHVVETHNHADHVSGHGRLTAATGAVIYIHEAAEAEYEHEPLTDGAVIEVGSVRLEVIHTPGHRPEHSAFAVIDTHRGDTPWAVLTGDSLFVGDIARPDLAIDEEDGAREMFHSLHDRLLALPPEAEVWPAHLGGSLCGGPAMDMKICSTLAYERAHNELLREDDQDRFVARLLESLAPQPPNFQAIVALNRGPLLVDGVEARPLTPRQLEFQRNAGAIVVDVRTDQQFDEAHVPGALCIPAVQAGFGTRLAWLAGRDQPVALVGRDDADAARAARLALAIGLRTLGGYLAGGMTEWRRELRPVGRIERLAVKDLPACMRANSALQILDVREPKERKLAAIPGSHFEPWHDIRAVPDGLDPEQPIAVICASGQRSAIAASLLKRYGAKEVIHVVDGGVQTWKELTGGSA